MGTVPRVMYGGQSPSTSTGLSPVYLRPMKLIAIACLAMTTTAAVLTQSGDPKLVSTIAAAVDADHDAALALLERVVNINSGTMNLAGVRQVGRARRPRRPPGAAPAAPAAPARARPRRRPAGRGPPAPPGRPAQASLL